jgi:hypothetical protein
MLRKPSENFVANPSPIQNSDPDAKQGLVGTSDPVPEELPGMPSQSSQQAAQVSARQPQPCASSNNETPAFSNAPTLSVQQRFSLQRLE